MKALIIVPIVLVFLLGIVTGSIIFSSSQTVQISEPISIISPTQTVQAFAGDQLILNWTLTNRSNSPISVTASISTTFQSTITGFIGGHDGPTSTSNPITLWPGTDYIAFYLNVSSSVPVGTYQATLEVSR